MDYKRAFFQKIAFPIREFIKSRFSAMIFLGKIILDRKISNLAQSLSYTSIFSLFPIIAIFFAILGRVTRDEKIKEQILDFISNYFFPEYASRVFGKMEDLASDSFAFGIIGVPTLFLACIFLFMKVDISINLIWEIERKKKWFKNTFSFFMLVFFAPILMVFAFSIMPYLNSLPYYEDIIGNKWVNALLYQLLPMTASGIALFVLYIYVPGISVQVRAAFWGAIVSTILLQVIQYLVNYYIINFSKFSLIYGSLALIPILIIWIYAAWMVVLIGAAIAYIIQYHSDTNYINRRGIINDEAVLLTAINILIYLVRSFQKKDSAPDLDQIQYKLLINRKRLLTVLKVLERENLISNYRDISSRGHYIYRYQPAINPGKVTIEDLIPLFYRTKFTMVYDNPTNELVDYLGVYAFLRLKDISIQELIDNPPKYTNLISGKNQLIPTDVA